MGIYSTFNYDDREGIGTKYGDAARFAYSVTPFTAVATNYGEITLSWNQPSGKYSKIRLLRSQDGFPETEEDGVLLWEWIGLTDEYGNEPTGSDYAERLTAFVDGPSLSVPKLLNGTFAYYRIWLYTVDSEEWLAAGDAFTLSPKAHSYVTPDGGLELTTHDKFMDLLPKVFTTSTQSPIDEVDKNGILYNFLTGLTFNLDEAMSYADSVLPEYSGRYLSPGQVALSSFSLGLQLDSFTASKYQKRLIREAYYIYNRKGTQLATETYVEGLTGWAPSIRVSPNTFLSPQDSSFYKGVGFWQPVGGCTLISVGETVPLSSATVPYATDFVYTGKVVVSAAGAAISNGAISPVTRAATVEAGKTYTLSGQFKSATTQSVTPSITWYDRLGNVIKTDTAPSALSVGTAWTSIEQSDVVAPGGVFALATYSVSSNVVTVDFTINHGFEAGDVIVVTDSEISALNGTKTITAVSGTTISWSQTLADLTSTTASGIATLEDAIVAEYASVKYVFTNTGTVYVDMVQLAESRFTDYYEARELIIFLEPKKTNWILNPSFNPVNTTAWYLEAPTIGGPALVTSLSYVSPSTLEGSVDGTHMLQVDTAAGETFSLFTNIGIVPTNKFYSFSINLATLEAGAVEDGLSVLIDLHDPNLLPESPTPQDWVDSYITTVGGNQSITNPNNTWARNYVSGFIPDTYGEVYVRVRFQIDTANGSTLLVDDAQFESGYSPTDHFDGDIPASFGAVWEGGIANASNARSHIYPNKGIKITRLTENIREFLPINTPYIIETYAGIETRSNPD